MKNRHCLIAQCVLPGLLLMSFFSGCTLLPKHSARHTRDHAYIAYWPPPQGSKQLRLAVKDNIDMKGVVTTAGSQYLAKNSPPAERDAKCLELARQRHVQIVGKTNLGEFALKSSGMNDYYGTPKNPFRDEFIPGGSSSGSAVAVANGSADVALGTDTAGSVRVPAACCGIAGLKTTFGLVPIKGVFPISPKHLDTVGPIAKDVSHLVQGMDLLQEGFAARYHAAVAARPSAKQIKVGRLYLDGTDPAIDTAVDDALAAAGFHVVRLGAAFKAKWNKADKDGHTVALADAWVNDGKYAVKGGVESKTSTIILSGAVTESNYRDALKGQAQWKDALRRVFKKVDFIALPTLQTVPPRMPLFGGTVLFELQVLALQNTEPANLGGNPALAIPIPVKGKKVPVTSLQLVGRRLSEAELLNAGRLVESKQ